jgi:transposase
LMFLLRPPRFVSSTKAAPWFGEANAALSQKRSARWCARRHPQTDANDAHGLAQVVRTGWFREVAVKSMDAQTLRMLLMARAQLVSQRQSLGNNTNALRAFSDPLDSTRIPDFSRIGAACESPRRQIRE